MFKKLLFVSVLAVVVLAFVAVPVVKAGGLDAVGPAAAAAELTVDFVAGAAGLILSLCAAYVPKFRDWYAALAGDDKRLVMLGALLGASAVIFGAACGGFSADLGLPVVACDRGGLLLMVKIFVTAAIVNQAAFPILPYKVKVA